MEEPAVVLRKPLDELPSPPRPLIKPAAVIPKMALGTGSFWVCLLTGGRFVHGVQRSEQGRGSVPLAVVRRRGGPSRLHRQALLRSTERLDLRLLVDRQYDRLARRVHVQPGDFADFLLKVRIGRDLGLPPPRRTPSRAFPLQRRGHRRLHEPTCRRLGHRRRPSLRILSRRRSSVHSSA